MFGSWPGSNSTSMTGPMIWTIFPVLMLPLLFISSPRTAGPQPRDVLRLALPLLEGFGAADDVEQLLRDLLLACLVVLDREDFDHFLGVRGGRFHGGHARAVLARSRLHERAVDLHAYVALDGHGTKLVVEEPDLVDLARKVLLHEEVGQLAGVAVRETIPEAHVVALDRG